MSDYLATDSVFDDEVVASPKKRVRADDPGCNCSGRGIKPTSTISTVVSNEFDSGNHVCAFGDKEMENPKKRSRPDGDAEPSSLGDAESSTKRQKRDLKIMPYPDQHWDDRSADLWLVCEADGTVGKNGELCALPVHSLFMALLPGLAIYTEMEMDAEQENILVDAAKRGLEATPQGAGYFLKPITRAWDVTMLGFSYTTWKTFLSYFYSVGIPVHYATSEYYQVNIEPGLKLNEAHFTQNWREYVDIFSVCDAIPMAYRKFVLGVPTRLQADFYRNVVAHMRPTAIAVATCATLDGGGGFVIFEHDPIILRGFKECAERGDVDGMNAIYARDNVRLAWYAWTSCISKGCKISDTKFSAMLDEYVKGAHEGIDALVGLFVAFSGWSAGPEPTRYLAARLIKIFGEEYYVPCPVNVKIDTVPISPLLARGLRWCGVPCDLLEPPHGFALHAAPMLRSFGLYPNMQRPCSHDYWHSCFGLHAFNTRRFSRQNGIAMEYYGAWSYGICSFACPGRKFESDKRDRKRQM